MAQEFKRLFVSIGANTDDFTKKMTRIQKDLAGVGKVMSSAGATLTKGVTLPILAAGAGILALTQKVATVGDEIQKMSQRTGFSTEAISELKHAAELSGTSIEDLEKGVKKMQRTLYDVETGSKSAIDTLTALGLGYASLKNLSPEDQFDKIAMALARVEDPTRRSALAQEIFGKAGTQLLPMLADGAEGLAAMRQEAHDLGIVFSQEAADAAAKFNDDLDRLKKSFGGVFQELGMKLLPIMTDQLIPTIKHSVVPLVQKLADVVGRLVTWFANLNPFWQKLIILAIGLVVVVGPVLMVLGAMASGLASIIGFVTSLSGVLSIKTAKWVANTVAMVANRVALAATAIAQGIMTAATALWNMVVTAATAVTTAFGVALTFLTSPIGFVILGIGALIAIGVLLYKNWDSVVAFGKKTWESFKDFFVDLWEGIKDAVLDIWNSIVDGIKGFINNIIDGINVLINAINKIPGINIGEVGKLRLSTDQPAIRGFATGGIVPGPVGMPQLAVVHGGEEIRTPVQQSQQGGDTFNITLNVDAENIDSVQKIIRLFEGLQQGARAGLGVA